LLAVLIIMAAQVKRRQVDLPAVQGSNRSKTDVNKCTAKAALPNVFGGEGQC
jgi:hypothetical protein